MTLSNYPRKILKLSRLQQSQNSDFNIIHLVLIVNLTNDTLKIVLQVKSDINLAAMTFVDFLIYSEPPINDNMVF